MLKLNGKPKRSSALIMKKRSSTLIKMNTATGPIKLIAPEVLRIFGPPELEFPGLRLIPAVVPASRS